MTDKVAKTSVDYSPGMMSSRCGVCEYFLQPDGCEKVKGEIRSDYWCRLFKRET